MLVVGGVEVGGVATGGWVDGVGAAVAGEGSIVPIRYVAGERVGVGVAAAVTGVAGVAGGDGVRVRGPSGRATGVSSGRAGPTAGWSTVPRNGPRAVAARDGCPPFPSATAISARATTSAQTETTNVKTRRRRRSNSPRYTATLQLPAREANLVPGAVSARAAVTLSGFRNEPVRDARKRVRGRPGEGPPGAEPPLTPGRVRPRAPGRSAATPAWPSRV